ncbi:MAG: aminoglycoside phosphotransferase family protein [Chloroflexi bacterium]|nr:aminoglycoside phosphotransferase family protein [Chloroflexota bacterium]
MTPLVEVVSGASWLRRLRVAWDLPRPTGSTAPVPQRRFVERALLEQAGVVEQFAGCAAQGLVIQRLCQTETGALVARVAPPGGSGRTIVVKAEPGPLAAEGLSHHYQTVRRLRSIPSLAGWYDALPEPLGQGHLDGRSYILESALQGVPGRWLLAHAGTLAWLQRRAADVIVALGRATLVRRTVDAEEFERLVGRDLTRLGGLSVGLEARQLDDLRGLIEQELLGREVPLAWVHGDFWPGNLLVSWPRGGITGIVDWDRAVADELPVHDLYHLLTYPSAMLRRYRHGDVVVEKLLAGNLDLGERRLFEAVAEELDLPADAGFRRVAAIVYWLRFVVANLTRRLDLQNDDRWLARNVWPVLSWMNWRTA